jgi:hypothetical protein
VDNNYFAPGLFGKVKQNAYSLLMILGTLGASLLLGYGFVTNLWIVLLIFGMLAALLFISNVKVTILTLIIVVYSFDFLDSVLNILPRQATWLVELAIGSLLIRALFYIVTVKRRIPIRFIFFLPLFIAVFSIFINQQSLLVAVSGLRSHFKYLLMFFAIIILQVDLGFMRKIINILIGVAVLQVPLAVFQFLQVGVSGDWVVGSFARGGGNLLAVFVSFMIALIFSLGLTKKRIYYYGLIFLLFLLPALSNARGGFFLILLSILVVYIYAARRQNLKTHFRNSMVLATLLLFFFSFGIGIWDSFSPKSYLGKWMASPSNLVDSIIAYDYNISNYTMGRSRILDFGIAYNLIAGDPLHLLFGVGPGNASESFLGADFSGSYYRRYDLLKASFSAWPITILELGYGGLAAIATVYFYLFYKTFRSLNLIENSFWRSLNIGFLGVLVVFFFSGAYVNAWSSDQTALAFWLIAAGVYLSQKQNNVQTY